MPRRCFLTLRRVVRCGLISLLALATGCSFWETEGATVGGRAVAEESNAGNLPDKKVIGQLGTKLQNEGDDQEDRIMTNLEGINQPISDSDPLRTGVYAEEGTEQVLADDVVNLLPGRYDPSLNPVEAEKLRAKQLRKEIEADRIKLEKLESHADEEGANDSTIESDKETSENKGGH